MQLPTQEVPEIPRLGSWKEQSSLLLTAFAQASAKVPEVPLLSRRDLLLQSWSPAQGAGNHCSRAASQQLRELHEHHAGQGVHTAILSAQQSRTQPPFSTKSSCCQAGRWSPHMCWPDADSRGLEGMVAFCRLTRYHVWSRNTAGSRQATPVPPCSQNCDQ